MHFFKLHTLFTWLVNIDSYFFTLLKMLSSSVVNRHPSGATQRRLAALVAECGFAAATPAYLPCAAPVYVVPRHNKIYGAINDLIFFHRVCPSRTAVDARHHF